MTPETNAALADLESAARALHARPVPGGPVRFVRLAVGALLVLSGLGIAGYFWIFTATSEAVVSGRAVALAAPIAGLVEQFDLDVGDPVEPGQVLARIHNVRVDLGRLEQLRSQRASLEHRLVALRAEVDNTTAERQRQRREFDRQVLYEETEAARQLQEAEAHLGSLNASRARKEFDFKALTALLEKGLISRSEHEHALEELIVSARTAEAQSSAVTRLEERVRAIRAGLFIGAILPAQMARIDDLTARLANLDVAARELVANIATVDREIVFEEDQTSNLVEATLVSPVRGYVWKRAANSGQHVVAGTELVQLVDASSIQIEAYFHQRSQPDVGVGDVAMVSPVGSQSSIHGTVRWIGADASAQASAVAPQWNPKQDTAMRVLLSISESDQRRVWVGQRVRVAVSRTPASALASAGLFAVFKAIGFGS